MRQKSKKIDLQRSSIKILNQNKSSQPKAET